MIIRSGRIGSLKWRRQESYSHFCNNSDVIVKVRKISTTLINSDDRKKAPTCAKRHVSGQESFVWHNRGHEAERPSEPWPKGVHLT